VDQQLLIRRHGLDDLPSDSVHENLLMIGHPLLVLRIAFQNTLNYIVVDAVVSREMHHQTIESRLEFIQHFRFPERFDGGAACDDFQLRIIFLDGFQMMILRSPKFLWRNVYQFDGSLVQAVQYLMRISGGKFLDLHSKYKHCGTCSRNTFKQFYVNNNTHDRLWPPRPFCRRDERKNPVRVS